MNSSYKDEIILTINQLIEARMSIFEQIVNLAMSNEYKDLHETFDEGEGFDFSLSHFDNMKDVNVQHLVALCKQTEATIFTIMDLNGIKDEEINLDDGDK